MLKSQVRRVRDLLIKHPDGLSVQQMTKIINKEGETDYSASTISYWLKEAEKAGVATQTSPVLGKRGRPSQLFRACNE